MIGTIRSIYWKPEIRYIIDRIEILSTPQTMLVTTNEVSTKISLWGKELASQDAGKIHTQRSSLILCQPDYIVWIRPYLVNFDPATYRGDLAKHVKMLEQRVAKGQCFKTPYLGCREFSAKFALAEDDLKPIQDTRFIGTMPFLRLYGPDQAPMTMIQNVIMENGVVDYPQESYDNIFSQLT